MSELPKAILQIGKIDNKKCREYALAKFNPQECAKKYLNY
jgi:hypothetical protein